MIPNLPVYIPVVFGIVTLATLVVFYRMLASSPDEPVRTKSRLVMGVLVPWLLLQAGLAWGQVYGTHLEATPPKLFLFGLLPAFLSIVALFMSQAGRAFADGLSLRALTFLHVVRIPVELVLFGLYLHGAIPRLMTFEGGNLDIVSGLTAPLAIYFGFRGPIVARRPLLVWNFACLGLLVNIVTRALLSAPFPLQKLAFEQPNIAILHFPFVWLPTFIVPLVLCSHLAAIRQLLRIKPGLDQG